MPKCHIGDKVPSFKFECTDPNITSFADLKGKNIILYFYPKDNTPGCTLEGKDFKHFYPEFQKYDTVILGISRDNLKSHDKFCSKLQLPFPLISDLNEKLCKYFDVLIEKNMFLKIFVGIDRSTFLIDTKGTIKHIWRKVRAKNHAQEVLKFVENYLNN